MLAGRAETPLLEQLPQRMAAGVAVAVMVLPLPALAVLGVASGQKEIRSVPRERTAQAVGAMVFQQQA